MIVHQTVGVTPPTEARHHFTKAAQKRHPILIIKKDRIARIAARSDVIDCAGKLKSKGSGHGCRLACEKQSCQDLTPHSGNKNSPNGVFVSVLDDNQKCWDRKDETNSLACHRYV